MKKLAIILCMTLLLGCLLPFAVSAAAGDLDSYLVRHYDFLTVNSSGRPVDVINNKYPLYPCNVTTADGVGTVSNAANCYYSNGDLNDIKALSDMSVSMTFAASGTPTGSFAYAMQMTKLIDVYVTSAGVKVRTSDNKALMNASHPITMGETVMLIVSLDWTDSALNSNVYISTDGGKTYTVYTETVTDTTIVPSAYATGFCLGKANNNTSKGKDGILSFVYDDLCIYSKALSENDIKTLWNITEEDDTEEINSIAPHHIRMQSRTNASTYDVRFCAALDHLNYTEVGFEIIATDANGNELDRFDHATNSVYQSVLALGEPVTANDICEGSKYLMAYAVLEIPTNLGTVTFNVRTYGTDANGTFYSDTVTFTFNGSTYVA